MRSCKRKFLYFILTLTVTACSDVTGDIEPDAGMQPGDPDANGDVVPPDGCPHWYLDYDGDGHGRDDIWATSCEVSMTGWSRTAGDCDDDHAGINPGAAEIWYDGTDQDCDGGSDFDADGDGYEHHAFTGGRDCMDSDPAEHACGVSQEQAARTCLSLLEVEPELASGVYWIDPDGDGDTSDAWQAWCDMNRDDGGWTLVLQNNGHIGSGGDLSWVQATQEVIVRAGVMGPNLADFDLHVGLVEWGQIGTEARLEMGTEPELPVHQALYELTLDETDFYRLDMNAERIILGGTSPGLFRAHRGMKFSTFDLDNDTYSTNCASRFGHPWWYQACFNGSFWLGGNYGQAASWEGNVIKFPWAAIWLR